MMSARCRPASLRSSPYATKSRRCSEGAASAHTVRAGGTAGGGDRGGPVCVRGLIHRGGPDCSVADAASGAPFSVPSSESRIPPAEENRDSPA
jgi:hypothetical protein